MKTSPKKPAAAKVKIKGEMYSLLNSLSGILVQASVALTPAQKSKIGKEFYRTYKIMTKSLAKTYAAAPATRKRQYKSTAGKLAEVVRGSVPCPGVCCLGRPEASSEADCLNPLLPGNPGIWVCMPRPILEGRG